MNILQNRPETVKNIRSIVGWLARLWVAWLFGTHAFQAFLLDTDMLALFDYVGIGGPIATVLLILVGLIDLTVVGLSLFRPFLLLAIYATLWPIIPAIIEYLLEPVGIIHAIEHLILHMAPGILLLLSLLKWENFFHNS